MSLKEYKSKFIDGVIELLWKQWSALGVAGHCEAKTEAILDLEALIVFSSFAARFDERLYDLILSWIVSNGSWVNIQRLKALAKRGDFADVDSLRYMAGVVTHNGGRKWCALGDGDQVNVQPQHLFVDPDGASVSFVPHCDELALRYGFKRTVLVLRDLVVKPSVDSTAALLLRLRGLCGISARADILAALIDGRPKTTSELSDRCGYTWKSTNEALQELLATGLLLELRSSPRNCAYRLKDTAKFVDMISPGGCVSVNWIPIFEVICSVWKVISNPRLEMVSEDTFHGEIVGIQDEMKGRLAISGFDGIVNREGIVSLPALVIKKYFD